MPYFSIYSLPALAKYCALLNLTLVCAYSESIQATYRGLSCFPLVSSISAVLSPIGLGRSFYEDLMLPGLICSNPMTSTQSAAPFLTSVLAMCSPVDPVAHALLVL